MPHKSTLRTTPSLDHPIVLEGEATEEEWDANERAHERELHRRARLMRAVLWSAIGACAFLAGVVAVV